MSRAHWCLTNVSHILSFHFIMSKYRAIFSLLGFVSVSYRKSSSLSSSSPFNFKVNQVNVYVMLSYHFLFSVSWDCSLSHPASFPDSSFFLIFFSIHTRSSHRFLHRPHFHTTFITWKFVPLFAWLTSVWKIIIIIIILSSSFIVILERIVSWTKDFKKNRSMVSTD